MSAQPIPFALPFTHYAELGYLPIPIVWKDKRPAGGDGWNTRTYDYAELDTQQLGIGLLCNNIVGLDVDVDNKTLADKIERTVRRSLGLPKDAPKRIGRAPKRMLMARVNAPVKGWDLMHRPKEGGKGQTLFQLLGEGKQFVIHGIHPETGKPYTLDRPLPAHELLPVVTEEQLAEMRVAVGIVLIEAGYSITGTEGGHATVTGKFSSVARWRSADELGRVLEALRTIPPTIARPEWFKVACSLHDGTHGEEDGFELFHAWSSGEFLGVTPPNYKGQKDCWQVWRGLKPGKGISTGTLFGMAREIQERGSPREPATKKVADTPAPTTDAGWTLAGFMQEQPPSIRWVVHDLLTDGAHLLVGRPKGGKSWLSMDMVLCVATGKPFLGRDVEPCNVLWIAAEDDRNSLARRLHHVKAPASKRVDIFTMERLRAEKDQYEDDITLLSWLRAYLMEHTDTKFAVIDTHSTAKREMEGRSAKQSQSVTEEAYELSRECEVIGKEFGVCIVLVHHSRKNGGKGALDDYHQLINMSQTVVAGATASLVMVDYPDTEDPADPRRIFAIRGRHMRDQQVVIEFGERGFNLLGDYHEVKQSDAQAEVFSAITALLEDQDKTTIAEVASACGKHKNTVAGLLDRCKKKPGGLVWSGRTLVIKAGRNGGIWWAVGG
jgi:hypothetical protein